jgi:chaperone required for assembly of F1-ATPase
MNKDLKRFYKAVGVSEDQGGFRITLDGRVLRTPAKQELILEKRCLADAIAEEWEAQEGKVDPASMPMMSLVSTALDNVVPNREIVITETADYGAHDLLCYWATEEQPELRRRQSESWQPLLDWAALELDAALVTTTGILPTDQPAGALIALRKDVERLDDLELMAVAALTRAAGSLVLSLATAHGQIAAGEAAKLSLLDELYQAELWGEDEEALKRRQNLERDLLDAERFLGLVRVG